MNITSLTDPCNYEKIVDEETPQAERIAKYLRMLGVTELLDVGCGPGNYVECFREEGIWANGVDIDPRAGKNPNCWVDDVTQPATIIPSRRMVVSLEVGEHIPEDKSWHYIRYIAAVKPSIVLFSAARPGQGGDGHINCQEKPYWALRFNWLGFQYSHEETTRFVTYLQQGYHMGWLVNNAMIFTKTK